MQKYMFKNLDGLGSDDLLNPFRMMLYEEGMRHSSIVNEKSEYEWMIAVNVFYRIKAVMKTDYTPVSITYDSSGTCTHRLMDIKVVVCSDLPRGCVILDKACPESNKKLLGDISNGYSYVEASKPKFTFSPHDIPNYFTAPDESPTIMYNEMYNYNKMKEKNMLRFNIVNVIFNDPATIVFWRDGSKTVVKCKDEPYDPEKGLAMAIAKYCLGSNATKGDYYNAFRRWLPEEEKVSEVQLLTAKQLAEKTGQSVSTVLRDCRRGLHPGATKIDGKWMIPYSGMKKDDLNG